MNTCANIRKNIYLCIRFKVNYAVLLRKFVFSMTVPSLLVAQELVAHDLTPYYHNNKRKGEVDFLIEIGGQVLPIEVKSGKDYGVHRALANIMDCREYGLKEAIVFCNDNLHTVGNIVYAPFIW